MIVFLSLLLIHFIADFYLQKSTWIHSKVTKKHKSFGLLKHVGVHLFLNAVVLWLLLDKIDLTYFISLLTIVLTHYAIDIWKSYQAYKLPYFLIDQAAHIAVLIGVSLFINDVTFTQIHTYLTTAITLEVLAVLAGIIVLTKPLSFIIQLSLHNYTQDFDNDEKQKGLANAGELIGVLERLLVFTMVLAGQFAGVGFLLAAKSVFRFGDMREQKDRKLTEYIMLGTLLSIGSALLTGLLVKSQFG